VTPRVHASGGKVRYGRLRPDTNHYLKWAFSEAGNSVAVNRNRFPARHVSQLYHRIRHRKDHAKAVGAIHGTWRRRRTSNFQLSIYNSAACTPPEDTHAAVTAKR